MDRILVVGSSNTDLITRVKKFPKEGETVEAISFFKAMGGKGANQAMAAHRLGGEVNFITSVGNDSYGRDTLKFYSEEGLKVTESRVVEGVSSGTAIILVDELGENKIVITPGANEMLSSNYITENIAVLEESDIVLLQMEIPYQTIFTICQITRNKNKRIILNAAPARKLEESLLEMIDILIVNESEAETITGEKIAAVGQESVVDMLISMGASTVILTLGKNGSFMKNGETKIVLPGIEVDVLDTTGAGDTFCGALAVGLAKKINWLDCLEFANAASAMCVTRMNAQPSIPYESEVKVFLEQQNSSNDKSKTV